jgi:RNA polymerase sigma factor (sigma-70 family)
MDRHHPATRQGPRVVAGGSYADWEAIYEDNVTRVYRTLLAGVGNWADAEDLTAEVFLAALRPLRLSATVPEVRGYLRAVARTALKTYRRATSGVEVTSIEEIGDLVYDSEAPIGTAPQRVKALLEALPHHYRRILELRFLDGRSVKDCAEELGVSVANAKVLQHRALRLAARLPGKASMTKPTQSS